jgi:hypothetical protein
MAIQFHCPGCRQPVEVDDEWAGKLVACPYCRRTVTAPAESLLDVSSVPSAKPLAGSREVVAELPAEWHAAAPAAPSNIVAMVGLGLAVAGWLALVVSKVLMSPHLPTIERFYTEGGNFMDAQRRMFDHYGGNFPASLMVASLLVFTALGLWVAALICSLIGMRWPQRRPWAIAGLVLCGAFPFLMCIPF